MIFVTHGVVDNLNPRRISHALMLSRQAFIRHLQQRPAKYVPIAQAILGLGDALTVDDATLAALDQVLLARRFGHAVTWFVNGENVEEKLTYFPFQLSWMMDETSAPECLFEGRLWSLRTLPERKGFRRFLKVAYMSFTERQQIISLLEDLTLQLNLPGSIGLASLGTASRQNLQHAVRCGVDLGNHGWDHLNPRSLSSSTCVAGIATNRAWIETLQPDHGIYAPPYGASVSLPPQSCSFMLLADATLTAATHRGSMRDFGTINRSPLQLESTVFQPQQLDSQQLDLQARGLRLTTA